MERKKADSGILTEQRAIACDDKEKMRLSAAFADEILVHRT